MIEPETLFSVPECASLCGVGRGTVHYWIRNNKLHAFRKGRSFRISASDLIRFLRGTRRPIPEDLVDLAANRPLFIAPVSCWEYGHGASSESCRQCVVYTQGMDACFYAKATNSNRCSQSCSSCRYYRDVISPRIHFIHQIDTPAAVYRDLYFVAANQGFAEICGVDESELPGMGIENIIHPDSLATVIANARRRSLGDRDVPRYYPVFVSTRRNGRIKANIAVYPLNQPKGSYLVLGEEVDA